MVVRTVKLNLDHEDHTANALLSDLLDEGYDIVHVAEWRSDDLYAHIILYLAPDEDDHDEEVTWSPDRGDQLIRQFSDPPINQAGAIGNYVLDQYFQTGLVPNDGDIPF